MRSTVMLGILVGLVLSGWGLREWSQAGARSAWAMERAVLEGEVAEWEALLAGSREEVSLLKEREAAQAAEVAEMADRIGNLEAQRDHLRGRMETALAEAKEAAVLLEQAERDRQAALEAVLEAEALPARLRVEVEEYRARVGELEGELDRRMAEAAAGPRALEWGGVSGDGRVFVVEAGDWGASVVFPRPVYLVQGQRPVAAGWIHRREGAVWIGHAGRWMIDPSTLVKGENVFIVWRDEKEPHT